MSISVKTFKELAIGAYFIWVGAGALFGAIRSSYDKVQEIQKEAKPVYKNDTIERPIRGVYQATRVAGAAGFGGAVAGFVAATAPISIPAYMYWKGDFDTKEDPKNDANTSTKEAPKKD
jgi:hypothetical protein